MEIQRIEQFERFRQRLVASPWVMWAVGSVALACWALSIEPPDDASALLRGIFSYTARLGTLAVVVIPSFRAIINGGRPIVRDFFFGFAALTMVCTLLAQVGDPVIRWARSDPLGATAIGVALVLVRWVLELARPSPSAQAVEYAHGRLESAGSGVATSIQRPTPSAGDDKSTAAHEAGHALTHAALAALPADFVVVLEQDHHTSSLGFVTGVIDGENMLLRRPFAEWLMLMLLAGMSAEKALLGSETLGGASDFRKWVMVATAYLANGTKGLFYSEPKGADQVMFNKVALDNLQREQEALLADFFRLNVDVLRDLTEALQGRRRLDVEALTAFMQRVQFPAGFPRP